MSKLKTASALDDPAHQRPFPSWKTNQIFIKNLQILIREIADNVGISSSSHDNFSMFWAYNEQL